LAAQSLLEEADPMVVPNLGCEKVPSPLFCPLSQKFHLKKKGILMHMERLAGLSEPVAIEFNSPGLLKHEGQ